MAHSNYLEKLRQLAGKFKAEASKMRGQAHKSFSHTANNLSKSARKLFTRPGRD